MRGFIFYNGPSVLDGKPVIGIATGLLKSRKANRKTGSMVQCYILRADVAPLVAVATGEDESICGDCMRRGAPGRKRSCYVQVERGPTVVFKAAQRGVYPSLSLSDCADILAERGVRLGSYGDPAAIPFQVWQSILPNVDFVTGYTHAWRTFPAFKAYCMASADTATEAREAIKAGFRPFRVRRPDEPLLPREVVCPASEEAGKKTTCSACRACGGTSSKAKASIAIIAHGSKAGAFNRMEVQS